MRFADYLKRVDSLVAGDAAQSAWYEKLARQVREGEALFCDADTHKRTSLLGEFGNRVRTEEIKAWYSSPEGDSLFQGTSISSLTIPCELASPLEMRTIIDLETAMADHYIRLHDAYAGKVRGAIVEDVEGWIRGGLYYGVVVASKVVSQALGLTAARADIVRKVGGCLVDPHEITAYPQDVREKYFDKVAAGLECFDGIGLSRKELETSLILADISKPRLRKYEGKLLLAPVRCNEIAMLLAHGVKELVIEKTDGRISPKSLTVVIYDTDTPYTYHRLLGYNANPLAPVLPGLTALGASGTIDAFRWLYAYRVSLVAQKIQKGSLYSQAHGRFIPFVFFGVLVPRDAEILLDMANLDKLRYRGNLSPLMEFCYLLPLINEYLRGESPADVEEEINAGLK